MKKSITGRNRARNMLRISTGVLRKTSRPVGRERKKQRHRGNLVNALFTANYDAKGNRGHQARHRVNNRLQYDLSTVYNSRTDQKKCVQYTIGGGTRYRVVPVRTEPPRPSS